VCTMVSKSGTLVKVVIFIVVGQSFVKTVADEIGMGMLPVTTSTSDELLSCINIDDFNRR